MRDVDHLTHHEHQLHQRQIPGRIGPAALVKWCGGRRCCFGDGRATSLDNESSRALVEATSCEEGRATSPDNERNRVLVGTTSCEDDRRRYT